jgi:hypothetical protein
VSQRAFSRLPSLFETLEPRLLMAVIPVLNNNNSGAGSLRQAIADASAGDMVDLTGRDGTIYLTSGEMAIDKPLTIQGSGRIILSGEGQSRVFNVTSAGFLTLVDVHIRSGNAQSGVGGAIYSAGSLSITRGEIGSSQATSHGGAIYQTGAGNTLTLTDCYFGNSTVVAAADNDYLSGGAVHVVDSLTHISGCTFAENAVTIGARPASEYHNAWGGAVMFIGGEQSIINSTFYQNRAVASSFAIAYGGAISANLSTSFKLINNTIVSDHATNLTGTNESYGGGVQLGDVTAASVINNLFCLNEAKHYPDVHTRNSSLTTGGNYLLSPDAPSGDFVDGVNGNIVGKWSPPTSTLQYNGGPTPTMLSGFHDTIPGISTPDVPLYDQRGLPRLGAPDIGAVEYQGPPRAGYGRALTFDGIDDVVKATYKAALENQEFAFQAFVRLDANASGENTIFSYGTDSASAILISYNVTTQQLTFRAGSSDVVATLPRETLLGQWVLVVATRDADTMRLYVNHSERASASYSGSVPYAQTDHAYIGGSPNGTSFFKGTIDEVRLFKAVPYQLEVLPGGWDEFDLVVADWHFDEAGYTQRDFSATGADGLLMGADPAAASVLSTAPLKVTLNEDSWVIIYLPAYDPEGAHFSVELVTPPVHGIIQGVIFSNGFCNYVAYPEFFGTDTISYRASRWNEIAVSDPVTVTLQVTPLDDYPIFEPPDPPAAIVDVPYSWAVAASDIDSQTLIFNTLQLPPWLTMTDHGDGTATLSGTPSASDKPEDYVRITLSDATTTLERFYTVRVGVNHPPVFSITPTGNAIVSSTAYTATVNANDPDGEPVSIFSHNLPAWLTLTDHGNGTATITGTPSDELIGQVSFLVEVAAGQFVQTRSASLTLQPRAVYLDGGGTLRINGTTLADAIQVTRTDPTIVRVRRNGKITDFPAAKVKYIWMYTYDGNDQVSINAGVLPSYVSSGMGDDTLSGGEGPDILTGGGGRDLILGNGGADRLNGSGGSDRLFGYSGSDRLFGGDGNDTLDGGYGIDWLRGEAGNDTLLARDKNRDVLIGGDPNDAFTDYAQIDSLWDELHEIDTLLP